MNLKESNWLDQLNRILIYPVYWIFESSGLLNLVHCWYLHRKNWSMCAWCTMNLISRHFQTKNQSFAFIQRPYNFHEIKKYSFPMNYKWLMCFNGHFGERDKSITVLNVSKAWELCSKSHWFNGYLLLKGMSFFFKSDFQVQCQENNSNFRNQ